MTETELRAAVGTRLAAIVAAHVAYPLAIELDNFHTIDQVSQVNPYLLAYIDLLAADQADMADKPLVKQWGQLQLLAVVKEGTGTVAGATLRDFVLPYFDMESVSGIQFQAAELHKGATIKGWEHLPILVNFWFFRKKA